MNLETFGSHRHQFTDNRNDRSRQEQQQPSIEEAPKFDEVKWREEVKDMMLSVLLTHDRNKNMAHQSDLKPDDEVDEENRAFSVDGRKNDCDGGTMGVDNSDGGTLMDGEVEEHRDSIEHRKCRSQLLEQQPSIEEAPKFDVKWWEELKDMMLSVLLTHDRNKNMAH